MSERLRSDTGMRTEKIEHLLTWRRFKEALQEAEAYVRENPEDADSYALLAHVYFQQDAYDKALHWSKEALRRDPEHAGAWRTQVHIYYSREDWKTFSALLDEALRLFPTDSHYYFLKGSELLKRGKYAEARAELDRALQLHPFHSLYLAVLSYAEALLNEPERSKQTGALALRQDSDNPYVFLYLGWASDTRGDYDEAAEYLTQAVRLAPGDDQVRDEYLKILQKQLWFYRVLLFPEKLRKLKVWQILLIWIVSWMLFKPLIILFIIFYVAAHWISKWIVHVRVFGFRSPWK